MIDLTVDTNHRVLSMPLASPITFSFFLDLPIGYVFPPNSLVLPQKCKQIVELPRVATLSD